MWNPGRKKAEAGKGDGSREAHCVRLYLQPSFEMALKDRRFDAAPALQEMKIVLDAHASGLTHLFTINRNDGTQPDVAFAAYVESGSEKDARHLAGLLRSNHAVRSTEVERVTIRPTQQQGVPAACPA